LIRSGLLAQQPFTEALNFTARFTFARNPNLAANGRYPRRMELRAVLLILAGLAAFHT
jgi:hypothetical protein